METQNTEKRDAMLRTMIKILDILNEDELDLSEDVMALTWILKDMFNEMMKQAKDDRERGVIEKSRQLVAQVILGQI